MKQSKEHLTKQLKQRFKDTLILFFEIEKMLFLFEK